MIDMFKGLGVPVSVNGFKTVSENLGVANDPAVVWAILAVETRGFGFLPDRRQKILFERHVFRKRTGGRYDRVAPDLSNPKPGGYSGGPAEFDRLRRAAALDRTAALESASWGLGQVMGFNATSIGYATVDAMIESFNTGEDAQLQGCASFILSNVALQEALLKYDWNRVAFFYNGKNYEINKYPQKLEQYYASYLKKLPDVEIRANQARLAYLGFDPRGIDGVVGPSTIEATKAFQRSRNILDTGNFDKNTDTDTALKTLAGV